MKKVMKDSRTRIEEVKIVNMKYLERVKRNVDLLMESGRCCSPPSSESRWAEWDWGRGGRREGLAVTLDGPDFTLVVRGLDFIFSGKSRALREFRGDWYVRSARRKSNEL